MTTPADVFYHVQDNIDSATNELIYIFNIDKYNHDRWVFTRFYTGFVLTIFFGNMTNAMLAVYVYYTLVSFITQTLFRMPFTRKWINVDITDLSPEMASLYSYIYTAFLGSSSAYYFLITYGERNVVANLQDHSWPPTWNSIRWYLAIILFVMTIWCGGFDTGLRGKYIGCTTGSVVMWIVNIGLILLFFALCNEAADETYFIAWIFSLIFFGIMFLTPILLLSENAVLASTIYFNGIALIQERYDDLYKFIGFDLLTLLWFFIMCYSRWRSYDPHNQILFKSMRMIGIALDKPGAAPKV